MNRDFFVEVSCHCHINGDRLRTKVQCNISFVDLQAKLVEIMDGWLSLRPALKWHSFFSKSPFFISTLKVEFCFSKSFAFQCTPCTKTRQSKAISQIRWLKPGELLSDCSPIKLKRILSCSDKLQLCNKGCEFEKHCSDKDWKTVSEPMSALVVIIREYDKPTGNVQVILLQEPPVQSIYSISSRHRIILAIAASEAALFSFWD